MSVLKLKQNGAWVPISVGAQGRRGDTGAPGPQGPAGHTPVKGTDYFTAADKSEIAQAAAELVSVPSASSTTPKSPGTASAGSESAYARGDHVHPKQTVTKSDVGLGNVDNVKQYSASNPPPYPVKSVNGKTGAITVREVPAVTTADNGKFLRVVNGAWAAVEIANANGGSF